MAMVKTISKEFQNVRFDLFLDRQKVQRAVDKKSRTALSRTGGFVRTAVRRSMKKAPKKRTKSGRMSKAYQKFQGETGPPRWHTKGLKNNIFFFYDPRQKSVVIGPRPFRSTSTGKPSRRKSGASLLEFGGGAHVKVTNRKGQPWVRARFRPKPFMAPQMDAAQAKLRENLERVKFGA